MIKLPSGIDINNLIDDLRVWSWEAADILIYYSQLIKGSDNYHEILKNKNSEDPVTLADLKVNKLVIQKLSENYNEINWDILSEENVKGDSDDFKANSDWRWIFDPLDGTKDFIQGTPNYAMHLALTYKQKAYIGVVLIPEKNQLWISNGKNVWCENKEGSMLEPKISSKNNLKDMILVTSKNHRSKILNDLIDKINFKEVKVMGSIGCKIASIVSGESDIYISLSLPGKSCPKDWDFAAPETIIKGAKGKITDLDNQAIIYNKPNFDQRGIIIATNVGQHHEKLCLEIKEIIKKYDIVPLDY